MPRQLTQDEWDDWLHHPCTQALRTVLLRRVDRLKGLWAAGSFASTDLFVANSRAIGECKAYEDLWALEVNQVNGELDEE